MDINEIQSAPDADIPLAFDSFESDDWKVAKDTVAVIAKTVTPHAIWYAAPSFFGCEAVEGGFVGRAYMKSSVILIRTNGDEYSTVRTALHEAWHAIECLLTRQEFEAVDAAAGRGAMWQGDYMDSQVERRARAFQSYALYQIQMRAAPRTGRLGRLADRIVRMSLPAHERVFVAALDGKVGRRAIQRKWISRIRLDPQLVADVEQEAAAKVRFAQAVREEGYGAGRILADVARPAVSPIRNLVT